MRNKGTVLYVTTTVLCSLALVSIILRLLSPSTASQKKWIQVADDWYMILNFVSNPSRWPAGSPGFPSRMVLIESTYLDIHHWHDGVHHTQSVFHVYFPSFCPSRNLLVLAVHNNNYGRDIWTLTTREIKHIMIVSFFAPGLLVCKNK